MTPGPARVEIVMADLPELKAFLAATAEREVELLRRVTDLRYSMQMIASVEPHKQRCEEPDDTNCPRCIADAALAADDEWTADS